MGKLTIRTKLILSLSAILIFAFVATNVVNYQVSKASVRKNIIENALPLTSDNIYSEIQADLMMPVFVSSLMANDTFLKDWALGGEQDVTKITRYLKEIQDKYGFFSTFFVSDRTGNYYHFNGILKKISREDAHDSWFYDFKQLGAEHDLVVDTDEASENTLTIFINHRLNDYAGSLLGVTGVGLNLERVASLVDSYKEQYKRNIYLVDQDGLVKVHRDKGLVDRVNIHQEDGIDRVAGDILSHPEGNGFFEYDRDGRHILLTSRYIPEFGWYLLVEQDENEALASIRGNFVRNLVFGLLVVLFIIGINALTINRFQRRLERLAATDELTGAANRRVFEERFDMAQYLAERQGLPFSVVLFDLDDFKKINDELGHVAGDRILREVAAIAQDCIRKNDLLVRWGGDEFIILTAGGIVQAEDVAERVRGAVLKEGLLSGAEAVSISCGVAQYGGGDTLDSLTSRADDALYQAKDGGRNRTVSERKMPGARGSGPA
ncbi:diguanylate cyclase [Desulfuromonas sp.]|uniref:sensor domain-containing diguanylate cyclase n=1 Tax=Desulfuromonas sp. TaxID=892 RepID=UPI0025BA8E68|nr:diguanylate cyclase [Desulfuromonas sp.]